MQTPANEQTADIDRPAIGWEDLARYWDDERSTYDNLRDIGHWLNLANLRVPSEDDGATTCSATWRAAASASRRGRQA